jgi:hypothetical protein
VSRAVVAELNIRWQSLVALAPLPKQHRTGSAEQPQMSISNSHERIIAATPERIAATVADFDGIWPTQIAPTPRPQGRCLYDAGLMLWEEFDRPGATRAFRVVRPEGLQAEHWFDLEQVDGGTRLRHTVEGEALGKYDAIWTERIEPVHNRVLEALLDNVETAVASKD